MERKGKEILVVISNIFLSVYRQEDYSFVLRYLCHGAAVTWLSFIVYEEIFPHCSIEFLRINGPMQVDTHCAPQIGRAHV